MIRIKDKKGADMTIGTIILIILGLVVLVFLILAFTTTERSLFDVIRNIGGGGTNVATIVSACSVACNTGAEFDYTKTREVRFSKDNKADLSCQSLQDLNDGGQKRTICFDKGGARDSACAGQSEKGSANYSVTVECTAF